MPFVDTNIFLRYLTKDDPDKAQACFELFKRAEANQVTLRNLPGSAGLGIWRGWNRQHEAGAAAFGRVCG